MSIHDGLAEMEHTDGRSDVIEAPARVIGTTVIRPGVSRFYLAIFVLYAVALFASALYNRAGSSANEMSLWDLQDTRLLFAWISAQVWSGLLKGIRFLPLGFLAPAVLAA